MARSVRHSSIRPRHDQIVLPAESAILPGARSFPPVPLTEPFVIHGRPTTYRYLEDALREVV